MRIERYLLIGLVPVLFLFRSLPAGGESGTVVRETGRSTDVAALLEQVGKEASGFQTLRTSFVQEKRLAVFKDTVVLKGRIVLQKPDRIAWHVSSPLRYSVVLSSASIRQWDEDTNSVQTISLAKNPVLMNVLGQLSVWFSGEYRSLLKEFDVTVLRKGPIAFRFVPKGTAMAAKVLRDIEIEFRADRKYLQSIAIHELSGDSTVITFTDTEFNIPLDAREFEVKPRV